MQLFRYIAYHYLKFFLIILVALMTFIVGLDFVAQSDKIPDSANLVLLYLMYKSFFAIDLMGPLSLVFAMIATKIFLIRSNALVAFYALGYSKTDVLKPFVFVSTLLVVLHIGLHATSFARADERAAVIRQDAEQLQPTENLFFTYSGQYVYFGHLYPLQQRAEDIRIFKMEDRRLREVIVAERARYERDYWHIDSARMIRKPEKPVVGGQGITVEALNDLKVLKEFRPKILDQVYEGKVNFTIGDAFDAMRLLNEQKVNVDRIKSALYRMFVHPFFVPCLVVIIFFFVPLSSRFMNLSIFSFAAILATLITWAVMYSMIELSNTKAIPSEVGIVLPIVLLFFTALWQWQRNRARA